MSQPTPTPQSETVLTAIRGDDFRDTGSASIPIEDDPRAMRWLQIIVNGSDHSDGCPEPELCEALMERIGPLEARITELHSLLENYGKHHPWCDDEPCSCGFAAALVEQRGTDRG